ncbi:MAG: lipoate--protein ligase family protein [Candidatus Omnitrophica bacterium]|nr:lipoate--protein ligase family protein [Candidatus Omnitrophota bacterium]
MRYLDLTFATPQENLACDEALLELGEATGQELLRVWQPRQHFVVLGYGNAHRIEADLDACRRRRIPVLRRISGGGTVLQGPGCLNFSLILRIRPGPLQTITGTTRFVLARHQEALAPLVAAPVRLAGSSDLTLGNRKCSGNAQRRKRRCVLFHGTLLLHLNLQLMEQLLPLPARRPAYRRDRPHQRFLINLGLAPDRVKAALQQVWDPTGLLERVPLEHISRLARSQYATDAWNYRL